MNMFGDEKQREQMFAGEVKDAFRNYVQQNDAIQYDEVPQGIVLLDVTHSNLKQKWHNIRFESHATLEEIKDKLYRHGGTSCWAMDLYLRRSPGDTVYMSNTGWSLDKYGAHHGMELYIEDNDEYSVSRNGGLENIDLVEKYEMTDEVYDKLQNTVRKQIQAKRKAEAEYRKMNPDLFPPRPETPQKDRDMWNEHVQNQARCEIHPGGRRGTVKFFGNLGKLAEEGSWIGVELDEPTGKNNGQAPSGKQMFVCEKGDKYGIFGRSNNITVGDFPELDPFEGLSDDEI